MHSKAESTNTIQYDASADPEGGGQGVRTPPPLENHVIWVSLGNKQLDPPGKSWTPPPPP